MSQIAALENTLESAIKDQTLVLNQTVLDQTLLKPFPNNSIPLNSVTIELKDNNSLVLTGKITDPWKPGGLDSVSIDELSLTATFTDVDNKIEAAFSFTGSLSVAGSAIAVSGSVNKEKIEFGLDNPQASSIGDIANAFSNGAMTEILPALTVLNSVDLNSLHLAFASGDNASTDVALEFGVNATWNLIPNVLSVGDLKAKVNITYSKSDAGEYSLFYGGSLAGTITAGIAYVVEIPFSSSENIDIIISPQSAATPASILDLATLVGGSSLRATMKTALNAVKLTEIGIDSVTISFNTQSKELRYITATAHAVVAGVDGQVSITIPGDPSAKNAAWLINLSAAQETAIPVGNMVDYVTTKYGKFSLPEILNSTEVSNFSLAVNTGDSSISLGFDTDISPSKSQVLESQIKVKLTKTTKGFDKVFSGSLLFNGLQFALDFSSSSNSTAFSASYNNSQNSPANDGLPGYGVSAPKSGTLNDVISTIFPTALNNAIPDILKDSLNLITVSDNAISIAGVASVSYSEISLAYKKSGQKTTWTVGFTGGIEIGGFVDLSGRLDVEIGEANSIKFVADADSGQLPSIPIPLPSSGNMPHMEPKLQSVSFTKTGKSFEFSSAVVVNFIGFSGLLDDIFPESSTATLTIKNDTQSLSISELVQGVEIPLPDIPVPGGSDIELGKIFLKLSNFTVTTGAKPSLSIDLDIGLPSKLNNLFGTTKGKPNIELFNTYDPKNPESTLVKSRVSSNGSKLSVQLLTSPLKAVSTFEENGKAWWAIDMGAFGAANVMVPELSYTTGSTGLKASGGFDIVRPLSIPLTPLKWFMQTVFGKEIANVIPESVPLKEINILDNKENLNVGEFKKLWGGNFPSELDSVIDLIDSGVHKLPDRLKSYFNIQIPKSLLFDITIDSSGGMQGSLAVKKNDPPIRILYPGMAGPLPALNGLELRKVSFGEILSGQLFTLEIDATFDQFNLLTIAASLAMPNSDANILPKSQKLQQTVELKNLFAIIFYQAGVPIPIPIFYDKIGIDYLGFEGLGVGSHFKFPKPSANIGELASILSQFSEFFTKPSYLLNAKNPPKDTDLKFTIGGNFLQLPNYVGGSVLGKKTTIDVISAWTLLAHSLNWLKTFSINEFIQSFPLDKRIGTESISFFNVAAIDVAWAFTTPHEFEETAYKKLKIKPNDRAGVLAVLPSEVDKKDEGFVLLLRGGFKIANTLSFQSTFGLAGSNAEGFATGFSHKGKIANLVGVELSGAIALSPKNSPHFQLIGKTKLTVLEQTVMAGELYLSEQKLTISGLIDLFPGVKGVSATSKIQGEFSSKKVSLTGKANFSVGNVSFIKGNLLLSESQFKVDGKFLGIKTTLSILKVKNELCIKGSTGTSLDFEVKTGAIKIEGVKVADGMSFGIDAAVTLAVAATKDSFSLGVAAKFEVKGKGFNVKFTMHIVPSKIAAVTEELIKQIVAEIEKYFKQLFKNAAEWLEGVASGAIKMLENTAENAAKVFKGAYKATSKQCTELLKSAGHTVEDIGGALKGVYNETGEEVTKLLKGAGYAAEEVGKALESAFSSTAEDAAKFLKGAGYEAEEVGKALQKTFKQSAKQAAKLLKGAGYAADEVGRALEKTFNQTAEKAAKLLKGVGYAASEVGKVLKNVYGQGAQKAAQLLKGAGYAADQVGNALKSGFGRTSQQAAKLLKGAGYVANDVGKALKSAYGTSAKNAAKLLKGAGYTANQVGGALKSGFNTTAESAAKFMKGAGYTASQVGGALKGTFTNSAKTAANALKAAGYTANEAASVMKNTFNASANAVADVLKSSYGLGSKAVSSVLKTVKYPARAINKVMEDIFKIFPHVKVPHVKHLKVPHIKHVKFW